MSNTLYRVIQTVKGRITPTVLNKTAAYTVTADQLLYGAIIGNSGATGTVVFTLPTAQPGMCMDVAVAAAFTLTLDLPVGDTIRTLAASGQTFSASAVGGTLRLVCLVPTVWETIGAVDGTWAAA